MEKRKTSSKVMRKVAYEGDLNVGIFPLWE